MHGARYVINSHTAAFLSPKWRWSLKLHSFLSRHALTTIVTNNSLRDIVAGWGCDAFCARIYSRPVPTRHPLSARRGVQCAGSERYAEDEPLDRVFEAAARLPDVSFYITGNSKRIAPKLMSVKPDNCHLTGYIPYEQYVGLMRQVDTVIDLTDRDHTLLLGAFEAVSLGTPLIISDWPILREYFSHGAVHVANTADAICEGIQQAKREHTTLRKEIALLRDELQNEWEHKHAQLELLLGGAL